MDDLNMFASFAYSGKDAVELKKSFGTINSKSLNTNTGVEKKNVKKEQGSESSNQPTSKKIKVEHESPKIRSAVTSGSRSTDLKGKIIKTEKQGGLLSLSGERNTSKDEKIFQLSLINEYRAGHEATVDEFHRFLLSLRGVLGRYWALIACLLSVQCRDVVALKVIRLIIHKCPAGPEDIQALSEVQLEEMCKSCNFYKTKAKNIRLVTKDIVELFNSQVPCDYKELLSLHGVGPKIAHLMRSVAFSKDDTGIVVDTHVHRISGLLGWVPKDVSSPEATRINLERWVPKGEWTQFTLSVCGFGQHTRKKDWSKDFLSQYQPGTRKHLAAEKIVRLIESGNVKAIPK